MKEIDLCWLAGLLEAEGSFMKGPPSAPRTPRLKVTSTDQDVVRRTADLFGINCITCERRGCDDKGWKPTYTVMLKGRRAVQLMIRLYPLMGRRRQSQIERAVASQRADLVETLERDDECLSDPECALSWLAGYLEGEGSFLKGPPSRPNRPRIQAMSTDRDVIERVRDLLGASTVTTYERPGGDYKPAYLVKIRGRRAVAMMERLYPLMGKRRQEQITGVLESYKPDLPAQFPRGRRHPNAVLTEEDVRVIRRRLAEGETMASLGREYGVDLTSIRNIRDRKTWAWVE